MGVQVELDMTDEDRRIMRGVYPRYSTPDSASRSEKWLPGMLARYAGRR